MNIDVKEAWSKRIVIFVNVDWFFISHRLYIGLAALEEGADVSIVCGDTGKADYLRSLGFDVYPLDVSRSGLNILREMKTFLKLFMYLRQDKPDVLHNVTIKPVVYGGIAARLLSIRKSVSSISGMGYVFGSQSLKARILKMCVTFLYRWIFMDRSSQIIFQNTSDRDFFLSSKIVATEQVNMIRGSGVNLQQYRYTQENLDGLPVIMFIARLLIDKGVRDFVRAAEIVSEKGFLARFVVVGSIDSDNPNSITDDELQGWIKSQLVEYWGFTDNPAETIQNSNIVVLPSFYAEGLPKTLIEAAALGRAVVTTDMPGCREAIQPGVSGFLVPPRDPVKLAEAILHLISDCSKRLDMGRKGRQLAEEAFDIRDVVKKHIELYGLSE